MRESRAKVTVGVRLPREQVERIRQLAAQERDTSTVVRQLIADGLAKHERTEVAGAR